MRTAREIQGTKMPMHKEIPASSIKTLAFHFGGKKGKKYFSIKTLRKHAKFEASMISIKIKSVQDKF